MIKKFECKTCKKRFEADIQSRVVCPHCQSDNVEICNHQHIPGWVWKTLSAIFVVLLAGWAVFHFFLSPDNPTNPTTSQWDEDSVSVGYIDPQDPPTVRISEPSWSKDLMYSVNVKALNVDGNMKFYYVMLSHFEKKVLQKSDDGHFSNIPYCAEDGHSYDFAIMDSNTDTLLCVPVSQIGFVKQITIDDDKKMTVEQLQKLIDTQDSSLNGIGENAYLAPDYKLEFVNLPSDMNKPESWSEIFEMLDFEIWKNVTVTKLSYDEKKRINKVTLRISL